MCWHWWGHALYLRDGADLPVETIGRLAADAALVDEPDYAAALLTARLGTIEEAARPVWLAAIDAIRAAQAPHHFLSVTKDGHSAIVSTTGNEDCHVILRGGRSPNYDAKNIDAAAKSMAEAGIPARIIIDCSHGNSGKEPEKQVEVGRQVATQIAEGDARIFGVMIESHLKAGRQDLMPGKELVYGLSITDACVGWEDTRKLVEDLADAVRRRRLKAAAEGEAE